MNKKGQQLSIRTGVRQHQDHGPNWSFMEILALVDTNCDDFSKEFDTIDALYLIDSKATK